MSEPKHTPGPWKADKCKVCPERGAVFVEGPEGWAEQPVCSTYETDIETDEANAAFIVRACNSHYDLLAVAQLALTKFPKCGCENSPVPCSRCFILHCIAKAKGEK